MPPIDRDSPFSPNRDKPPIFASPMGDADVDGPDEPMKATRRGGLAFCPNCQGGIALSAELSGLIASCPHCSQHLRMPETLDLGFDPSNSAPFNTRLVAAQGKAGEPWYYSFIDTYANVWLWFSLIVFGLVVVATLGLTYIAFHRAPIQNAGFVLIVPVVAVLSLIPSFLGILLTVAFMRLLVDIARNLREIRQRRSNSNV
ncbi:hypothetical protein [Singulisphaera sp. PoT]|uniref:hypothetical protein n=1 Tax=Singulisphaera sp. PoT TaxID=3411797 RepID=UPI003BF48DC1